MASRVPPSLLSLCTAVITAALVPHHHKRDGDTGEEGGLAEDVLELPSQLLDLVVKAAPPIALQTLQEILLNDRIVRRSSPKRIKCESPEQYNTAWELLFRKRWPTYNLAVEPFYKFSGMSDRTLDWQQMYWGKHLQECFDEAAETAMLPMFNCSFDELNLSDQIMISIGYAKSMAQGCEKLSYHCKQFGSFARYLRLQNVLCTKEICTFLRASKLHGVTFVRIISKNQVEGACMLLRDHRKTLLDLNFLHCQLCPDYLDQICCCLYEEGSEIHSIRRLEFEQTSISNKSSLISHSLLNFLSSGRYLQRFTFRDSKMNPYFASAVLNSLLRSSSKLLRLNISEHDISGWLSRFNQHHVVSQQVEPIVFLNSLTALCLRGNNLCKDDAENLCHLLLKMPKLESLDISENPIGDDGIRCLAPFFSWARKKVKPLSDVKVENCNLSSSGLIAVLESLLSVEKHLHLLSIADNNLDSSGAAALARVLGSASLRELNFEDAGLGSAGFRILQERMPEKIHLSHINLSKNRGGMEAATFLHQLILRSPNLKSVNAASNIMPPESVPTIFSALQKSEGKMEHLDLSGNTLLSRSTLWPSLLGIQASSGSGRAVVNFAAHAPSFWSYDDDP